MVKFVGPRVSALGRQFFVAMNGPQSQFLEFPIFIRCLEERLCQYDTTKLMEALLLTAEFSLGLGLGLG